MKKTVKMIKKISALMLSIILAVTLFSVVPIVEAEGPVWSEAFAKKLINDHPLSDGQVYVGYGKKSIMPRASESNKLPLSGYGREEDRLAIIGGTNTAMQQELYTIVTAVMDGKGNLMIFIVNDLSRASRATQISDKVSKRTGIPADKIFVSGTHSHASVAQGISSNKVSADLDNYLLYVDEQTAEATVEAVKDLYPSDMYVKSVKAEDNGKPTINFIRHYTTSKKDYNGDPVTYANNHGYYYWTGSKWATASDYITGHLTQSDTELQVVRFERGDNNNVLMCNFQVHPTIQGGSDQLVASSDIVGTFRNAIERELPNYRSIYFQGAAGNLNPRSDISGEHYSEKNNSGAVKYVDVNGSGETITWNKGTEGVTLSSGNGRTESQARALAAYLIGNKLASYLINNFNISTFTPVNGGTVKSQKYTYSAPYRDDYDDVTVNSAEYLNALIWNPTNNNLKKIIYGSYPFTDAHIEYMSVINETVTTAQIDEVKTRSERTDLTDEQATTIAKFLKRVRSTIDSDSIFYNGSTYMFFKTYYSSSKRYNSIDNFATTIPQKARTRLINLLGHLVQSKEHSRIIQSPYHSNAIITAATAKEKVVADLYTATIGDVSFATFPGEMFDTNGKYVKENTASKMTIIMGYSNGATGGYFPSAYGFLYTTYESDTTKIKQGVAELWAGLQTDSVSDLTFDGDTYEMSVGDTKTLLKASGEKLYNHTDSFDYSLGSQYSGGSDLAKYSYSNISTTWSSSNTSVATVDSNGKITARGNGTATITVVHKSGNAAGSYTGSASCTVVVSGHSHCDDCAKYDCKDISHAKYTYTKWTSTTTLPTTKGHYYLQNNVTLSAPAVISQDVTICLNGKKVTANSADGGITVNGGSLTLCDCRDTGSVINGKTTATAPLLNIQNGTFRITGGSVDNSRVTESDVSAVTVEADGTMLIEGGAIIGGTTIARGATVSNRGTLVMTGGGVAGGTTTDLGGAIYCKGKKTELKGGTVTGGEANMGGALYVADKTTVINGATVQGGKATNGGTITVDSDDILTISGGIISGGEAKSGGCIYMTKASTVNMTGGTITGGVSKNAEASALGGNIYMYSSAGYQSVFNMSGGTIDNGSAYGMGGNLYVNAESIFNMSGGTIQNGTSNKFVPLEGSATGGHGGNVYLAGQFNMSDGTITAGVAMGSGGGNFSINGGTPKLTMTGGIIKNGVSPIEGRGNVYIWNNASGVCLDMSGGKITDDSGLLRKSGGYGGGVYVTDKNANGEVIDRTIRISGNAVIDGNILKHIYNASSGSTTYEYQNVYLQTGKYITVGDCVSAYVKVTMQDVTADDGVFTVGGANARSSFAYDKAGYYAVKSGENLAFSETPDTSSDELKAREGTPSDIPLPTSDAPEKDDYLHFNIANGSTLDVSTKISGVTSVKKTSNGAYTTLTGTKVKGTKDGVADTFEAVTNSGTVKFVVAVGHYHCLECGTFGCQIHNNISFTASSSFSISTSTNTYLTGDVTLTDAARNGGDGITTNICLNGYRVDGPTKNRAMYMNKANCTLSITDCSEGQTGTIAANSKENTDGNEGYFNWSGALLTVSTKNTFNLYRGTLDSSAVIQNGSTYGGVVTNSGTLNMYGGKMIGGIGARGGGIYYSSNTASEFNMYGGTLDAYNVVTSWGTLIQTNGKINLYNGRMIGGTHTISGNSKSNYYNSSGYYGAITLLNGAVMTVNGGVIQDGTAIREVVYNEDGSIVGIRHPGGNIHVKSGATLNINGGIIANGTAYGTGGNLNIDAGATVNMTGGVIKDGKAYKVDFDASANGSHGGNVLDNGTFNMSGGTIEGGISYDAPGGNVSVYSTNALFNMTGGVIKNGVSTSARKGSGNVGVWYHAGNLEGTKIAFDMSGGLITCDDGFEAPAGMYAGGIRSYYSGEGYQKRVRISGSANIYASNGLNLYVDDNETAIINIGELNSDANIYTTLISKCNIAYDVPASSLAYIKSGATGKYVLSYDSTTGILSSVPGDKTQAAAFIQTYLTAADGHYFTDPANPADSERVLSSGINAYWNALSSEEQNDINNVYNSLCGVSDISALLAGAATNLAAQKAEAQEFVNNYFKKDSAVITDVTGFAEAVTLDGFFAEKGTYEAWEEKSEGVKLLADNIVSAQSNDKNVDEIIEMVKEYMRMLNVNIIVGQDKKDYIFFAGVDNLSDYKSVGFVIDYGYAVTTLTTTSVCTSDMFGKNGIPTTDEMPGDTQYIFKCDYRLYMRDYNSNATVRAFLVKNNGEIIYGNPENITFSVN